jgi:uncharacterized membrane protein/predicted DsbA family dithiol-disulfide isomerase
MQRSLTMNGVPWPRILGFISGLGMMVASYSTIDHFFAMNYPVSIYEGVFCDISAFFNCDASVFSSISRITGMPLGYFGLMVGALVILGTVFPSKGLERTNRSIALLNITGVIVLFLYSVIIVGSLCLLCTGYYIFSAFSFFLLWKYRSREEGAGFVSEYLNPSLKILLSFGVVTLIGAYGFYEYHEAKKEGYTGGVTSHVADEFLDLLTVPYPSIISPYWTARSTERFEDAPIQVVEYCDFLCPDCLFLYEQLTRLKREFRGKINIAFQFFPLDGSCNDVVDKNLHPGACELSCIAAHDPEKFTRIHDEIFENFSELRNPRWRSELASRYGVDAALTDTETHAIVQRIIDTGAEYERTSDSYAHGIRSTPTMIINNRLVIGTFPYEQMKAIFQALVERHRPGEKPEFMENWERR